ncbi:MAG: universal stress protein [Phenylobacterium sp.]|uniref:universal stress protein n=1 Tax=Phenylobacterium sp. TaxID=1871053 RepID=UPI001A4EE5EE|nr:universal stress protein [Phenylobacterium sp.]MBL8770903.1 universal stress protein [Phenylobacterium sp.]
MQTTKERTTPAVAQSDVYPTILVHAEPGLASSHRVEAAARLARDLDARLIGLGAETFDPSLTAGPFMGYEAGQWVGLVQEEIEKSIANAEKAFSRDSAGAKVEWRSMQDYPHRALLMLARAADLIVMSPASKAGRQRNADPADVVMSAGRPVLIVPEGRQHLRAKSVVVAWKDTRECRRAIADALPFLKRAEDVIVYAVVKPEEVDAAAFEVDDVIVNLKAHRVNARPLVNAVPQDGVTNAIERVAQHSGADLVVCGAYGHARAREWAFGGVTEDLIHAPKYFVLMSH